MAEHTHAKTTQIIKAWPFLQSRSNTQTKLVQFGCVFVGPCSESQKLESGCTTALLKRGVLQSAVGPSGRFFGSERYLGDLVRNLKGDVCRLIVVEMFDREDGLPLLWERGLVM
jgi:hypothetical protein